MVIIEVVVVVEEEEERDAEEDGLSRTLLGDNYMSREHRAP